MTRDDLEIYGKRISDATCEPMGDGIVSVMINERQGLAIAEIIESMIGQMLRERLSHMKDGHDET